MNDKLTRNEAEVAAQPDDNQQETIRMRAYELSQRRNGSGGDELSDWLQAEREILAETEMEAFDHKNVCAKNPPEKRGVIVTDPALSAG